VNLHDAMAVQCALDPAAFASRAASAAASAVVRRARLSDAHGAALAATVAAEPRIALRAMRRARAVVVTGPASSGHSLDAAAADSALDRPSLLALRSRFRVSAVRR
jgi:hypothetical protein